MIKGKKIDAMTVGAVAFAGFALWYVLRGSKNTGTGSAAGDTVYGLMTTQRREVGDALGANLDYMGGGFGMLPSSVGSSGGSYGLQTPNSGFWAV